MATHMRDDKLGTWTEQEIEGSHVEWRRRPSRAQDAHLGTELVIDISVDGAAPVTQWDFNAGLDQDQELALRVRRLR